MARNDSVWKTLGVYVAASWVILQGCDMLAQNIGLPTWVFPAALALLAIGLPVVAAATYVNDRNQDGSGPTVGITRRLLTRRNALLGGVGAFALLGVSVAGYFVMWSMGIGPVGSLVARGVIEADDPVILAEFENESSDPQIASVVTSTLRVDLEQSNVMRILPDVYVANVLQRMGRDRGQALTAELAREAATREGIGAVIEGEVASLGPGFVLTARIVDPANGVSFASFRETAETEAGLVSALDRLSRSLRERAGESLRSIVRSEPLEAVTTGSLTALRKYTRALALEEDGDLLQAITLLEEAVEEDSAFAMAHRKLAVAHGNRGEEERRREYAAKAYKFRDRLTSAERHLATAYYFSSIGDREQAIQEYEALLRLDPHQRTALNNLAIWYRSAGRLEDAVALLERAVSGTGESNTAHSNLIEDYLELGDVDAARAALERFETRFPEQYWMYRPRALLGITEGDAPSVHAAAAAILADPSTSGGRRRGAVRYMAMVDMRLGRMREAADHLLQGAAMADSAGGVGAFWEADACLALLAIGDAELGPLMKRIRARMDRPAERAAAGSLAHLYLKAGAADEGSDLARVSETWPQDDSPVAAAVAQVQVVAHAIAGDSAALSLLDEAESLTACQGCLRDLRIDVLDALGMWSSLIEVGEDVLSRPLDATWSPGTEPLVRLRLARAYLAMGAEGEAAEHSARVAELWRGGDPGVQRLVAGLDRR